MTTRKTIVTTITFLFLYMLCNNQTEQQLLKIYYVMASRQRLQLRRSQLMAVPLWTLHLSISIYNVSPTIMFIAGLHRTDNDWIRNMLGITQNHSSIPAIIYIQCSRRILFKFWNVEMKLFFNKRFNKLLIFPTIFFNYLFSFFAETLMDNDYLIGHDMLVPLPVPSDNISHDILFLYSFCWSWTPRPSNYEIAELYRL